MVIGIGIDLVEVERLRLSLERFGDRFLARVFTTQEQRSCADRRHPAEGLAARFAAKEAGAKALGTGLGRGIGWHDLEVVREEDHAPELRLGGNARLRAEALGVDRIHLSLTHSGAYATAIVLLESSANQGRPAT